MLLSSLKSFNTFPLTRHVPTPDWLTVPGVTLPPLLLQSTHLVTAPQTEQIHPNSGTLHLLCSSKIPIIQKARKMK